MSTCCRDWDEDLWCADGGLTNARILCEGHGVEETLSADGFRLHEAWHLPSWLVVKRYAFLGLVNSATVYLCYTPYQFLWVHLTLEQYVRWLEGGIPMSLGLGWLFALVMLQAARWFDGRAP